MSRSPVERQIERLRAEIRRHQHLYYVDHSPEISDSEFDALERQLKALENQNPALVTADSPTQRVGGALTPGFDAVQHQASMLSLDNAYSPDELREFEERIVRRIGPRTIEYCVEPKIDGVSIALRYEHRVLARAVTRGDGSRGDDVTVNVRGIANLPEYLNGSAPDHLEVRGEVFFPKARFALLNQKRASEGLPPLSNARNAAAGTLKTLNSVVAHERGLNVFVYQLVVDSTLRRAIRRQSEALHLMRSWELPTNQAAAIFTGIEGVIWHLRQFENERDSLDYEVDGAVVKVDLLRLQEELGATAKFPRWAVAFKFAAKQVTSTVNSINAQVGRTGKLTPVAHLEPVALGGVIVSRATLHNEEEIARKDIREGDTVVIERGGDVIPKIVEVVGSKRPAWTTPWSMPESCPECGSPTVKAESEVDRRCLNAACPAQVEERIKHFAGRDAMDIEGLGEALVGQLLEKKLIHDFADLYVLHERRADVLSLERMAARSVDKLLAAIDQSKRRELHRLLFGLGIRFVGNRGAKLLARHFKTMAGFLAAVPEEVESIPGLGPTVANSVHEWLRDPRNQRLLERLREAGVAMTEPDAEPVSNLLAGNAFVLTGTLRTLSRDQAKAQLESWGAVVAASVSKRTSAVFVGEDAGAKAEKASELHIPVLGEDDLLLGPEHILAKLDAARAR